MRYPQCKLTPSEGLAEERLRLVQAALLLKQAREVVGRRQRRWVRVRVHGTARIECLEQQRLGLSEAPAGLK